MTTSTRAAQAEADAASIAFQTALTQIGVETVEEAMALWRRVPPSQTGEVSAAWLRRAIRMVMTRRGQSRDLAMAYYRLVRALRTGTTVADPYNPEPPYVRLRDLREEFALLAGTRAPTGPVTLPEVDDPEPAEELEPESDTDPEVDDDDDDDESDRLLKEEIERLEAELERNEREAEREAETALKALGPENLKKKLREIDDSRPGSEVDAEREEARRQAGARQAAAAARIVRNGARSTLWSATRGDKRAIGYVRLSRTGTPCGFCAMLISRGVAYKTARTAGGGQYDDGDKYHDNCNCYAEPVFSMEEYENGERFALNRRYASEWPKVTEGLGGRDALNEWRSHIRRQQRAARSRATPTTNVQEA